ncbi:hypothetical protein H6G94_35750 [Nostoc punctiforme FACHB-252]|uniref:Uncharacterized protein n=1 Tax=Nostoc punctiforme FACHB-252 TaxID=1357509 RepID=A0ABR8HMT4_NOSPU|nr:hypothetical protein [Nostoc punctiforme]MBD2616514.1 hypothetical protein [Nostoc punctiforme FACHB-252]
MKELFEQQKKLMQPVQDMLKNSYVHQRLNQPELLRESILQQKSGLDNLRGRNSAFDTLRESVLQQKLVLDTLRERNSAFHILRESVLQQHSILDTFRGRNLALDALRESVAQQFLTKNLVEHSVVYDISLKQIFKDFQPINLIVNKPNFAIRLLEPSRIYTQFLDNTIKRILEAESQKVARVLQTSLHIAEIQLLTITEALSSIITVPIDDEVSDTRQLDLPFRRCIIEG